MPHVIQAAALRGVMKTLAGVWIVSKQTGVISRRADGLWCGGHTALSHQPPLTGKLIKCLIMSSSCSCSADGVLAAGKGSLGRSSVWLPLPMVLPLHCYRKPFPPPQADLQKRLIQDMPLPSSAAPAGWPFGDMCQAQGPSADVFAHPRLWLGEEMDGKVSVISMGNRATPGRWSVIF